MDIVKDPNYKSLGLDSFISNVTGKGISKANYFSAVITYPRAMMSSGFTLPISQPNFSLQCDTASIPGISLITNDVAVYGEARQMPTQRLFSEMSFSFYADINLNIKRFFDSWMDFIINPTTRTCRYYEDYVTGMEVVVHDKNLNIRYKVNLFECYPKSIQDITLDYSDTTPMKLRVSMMYKYYTIDSDIVEKEKLQAVINNSVNSDVSTPITVAKFTGVNNVAPDPTPPVSANFKFIPYKK